MAQKTETIEVTLPVHGVVYVTLSGVPEGASEDDILDRAMLACPKQPEQWMVVPEIVRGNVHISDEFPIEWSIGSRYEEEE